MRKEIIYTVDTETILEKELSVLSTKHCKISHIISDHLIE